MPTVRRSHGLAVGMALLVLWTVARWSREQPEAPPTESAPTSGVATPAEPSEATDAASFAGSGPSARSSLDVSTPATARLRIEVRQTDGRPAPGVRLMCYLPARRASTDPVRPARAEDCTEEILEDFVTDGAGDCLVAGFPAGGIYVASPIGLKGFFAVAAGETGVARFVISGGFEVRGRVVDATGEGVPDARVVLTRQPGLPEYASLAAITQAQGEFTLVGVPAGSALIAQCDGWRPSELIVIVQSSAEPVLLQLGARCDEINGVVMDGSGGVPGAAVYLHYLWVVQPTSTDEHPRQASWGCSAKADASGHFRLPEASEARGGVLWAYKDDHAIGRSTVDPGVRFYRIDLESECRLAVSVELDGSVEADEVVGYFTPEPWGPMTGEIFFGPLWARLSQRVEDGRMQFGHLPRGRGTLFITAPDMEDYAELVALTAGTNAHRVRLLGRASSPERAAATLRIIDATGAPLPGLDVRLHPPAGNPQRGTTDGGGEVRFPSFPVTPTAVVRVYDPRLDWPFPVYQSSDVDPFGAELRVSYARPGARVAGRVLGQGRENSAQLVLVRGEQEHRVTLDCDESGAFDAGSFPEGEYGLRVEVRGLGSVDAGRRTLVRGETLDCGDLELRSGGELRVLAEARYDGLRLGLSDAMRTFTAILQGGEAWFRGIPGGAYVLTPRGSDVAMLGVDVRIEPSVTRDVRVTPERGMPVTLQATASESRKLKEIWSDGRGRPLWNGPLRLWTPGELAGWRVDLVPGAYTFSFEDAEGRRAVNAFVVEPSASSLIVPVVLP